MLKLNGTSVVLVTLLASLAACAGEAPTSPARATQIALASASGGGSSSTARPFGGSCETYITPQEPELGDLPNYLRLRIEYICQLQHLGRTTAVATQLVIFTGPTRAIASNSTVYRAANGDELHSTWTGTSTADADGVIAFGGPETYKGGTGRFANAHGTSVVTGTGSLAGLPPFRGRFALAGTLAY